MDLNHIRNFVIIAHVDHGKSTLADRMLEITGTVPERLMRPQYLDQLQLERERGITIKMAPVRMMYHADRGLTRIDTRINADNGKLLYEELTYKIRGSFFNVYNTLGPGHKEIVYQRVLAEEFQKSGLKFIREKVLEVKYGDSSVGIYKPDFIVEDKVIIELMAQPFIGELEKKQTWHYIKGSPYRLAFLVNFGGKKLEIERIVYDTARFSIRENPRLDPRESAEVEYILNLIDTPGHSDFRYEVSRALAAVEGAVLLVDATQGIQAQTLANAEAARRSGLTMIGAVNKIDVAAPEQVEAAVHELAEYLGVAPESILRVSGKTGAGVEQLLRTIIERVPPPRRDPRESAPRNPRESAINARALIFDSLFDEHKGVIAFVRVVNGRFRRDEPIQFIATRAACKIKEIGYCTPKLDAALELYEGEIGYIATGFKDPALLKIGDTIIRVNPHLDPRASAGLALPGYAEPKPVVFVSFYPDDADRYEDLKKAFGKLRLTDASLHFEPDASEVLGRGFKAGFLGRLHFEIAAERLEREFGVATTHSFPSVAYRVRPRTNADTPRTDADNARTNAETVPRQFTPLPRKSASFPRESAGHYEVVTNPKDFTGDYAEVLEPMTRIEILTPLKFLSSVLGLKELFRFREIETHAMGAKVRIAAKLPLAELIRDLDDKLKSVSQGFASLNYEIIGWEPGDLQKLEVLVAGHAVPGLTRILPRDDIEREARVTVERLKELLPREQFVQAVQAASGGRIIARETIPAMRKELGNFGKNSGDRTRKMKLWKKQQRGKARLKELAAHAGVRIPASVFRELLKR